MKKPRFVWIFALLMLCPPLAPVRSGAQEKPRKAKSESAPAVAFKPLDNWKAAVLAGDKTALAAFYSKAPAAQIKTPAGLTQDPNVDPTFWSSLRGLGMNRLDFKILEVTKPQPNVLAFVFQCELGLHTESGDKPGVVSGTQVWAQEGDAWRIIQIQRSDLAAYVPRTLPEPKVPNTQLYPEAKEAPAEIASALRAARADHKRVILVFGGNWCYDCHVLDATFRSKDISPLVNRSYHVVHVNIGDYDQNLDLADKYEIPLKKGVPSLAVLDPDGKLLFSQKKGEFESTTRIGPKDVVAFLGQWKPQPR